MRVVPVVDQRPDGESTTDTKVHGPSAPQPLAASTIVWASHPPQQSHGLSGGFSRLEDAPHAANWISGHDSCAGGCSLRAELPEGDLHGKFPCHHQELGRGRELSV